MQLGTSATPCASRTTTGRPFSTYAARLNVVPRSMPTTDGFVMWSSWGEWNWASVALVDRVLEFAQPVENAEDDVDQFADDPQVEDVKRHGQRDQHGHP